MKPLAPIPCVLAALACASPEAPPQVPLIVQVTDEAQAPVKGARISVDGTVDGETDAKGLRETRLSVPEGRNVSVQAHCPDGYRPQESKPQRVTCRYLHDMDGNRGRYLPLTAHFTCGLAEQSWVLLVKTNAKEGLPVKALGETVAQTDRDGVAQALITGAPGEEMDVVIDTASAPELRPKDPSRRVHVPAKKQILIFEQTFKTDRPRTRRHRRFGMRRLGPRRI